MTQESFREHSGKELGRLEGQLAGLRQELAALTLKQSSVADQVGLLPQQLQAVRDDVRGNRANPRSNPPPSETTCPWSRRGAEPFPPLRPVPVSRAPALDPTWMSAPCDGSSSHFHI